MFGVSEVIVSCAGVGVGGSWSIILQPLNLATLAAM